MYEKEIGQEFSKRGFAENDFSKIFMAALKLRSSSEEELEIEAKKIINQMYQAAIESVQVLYKEETGKDVKSTHIFDNCLDTKNR